MDIFIRRLELFLFILFYSFTSKLKNSSEKELNLLAPILENKSKTLMKAIDYTNAKYGRNAISIAQAGINNDWKMRREHSSKIDTASFGLATQDKYIKLFNK